MANSNKHIVRQLVAAGVLIAIAGVFYLLGRSTGTPPRTSTSSQAASSPTPQSDDKDATTAGTQTDGRGDQSVFAELFDTNGAPSPARPEARLMIFLKVMLRLTLAALLTAVLAFRPRKFAILFKRNLFVAQTQILLAVVGSALMMIVGDSAARAFGIFAAVSLVRFRTNIRDPKEITVLLVSLGVGLATGVGRWDLAIILSLFVLMLLWALEYREQEMVFRAMELKVKTRSLVETHEIIRNILKKYDFSAEMRVLNREDEKDPFGTIVFCVEVSPLISTDELSAEILSADQDKIDSIEWEQQKRAIAYE